MIVASQTKNSASARVLTPSSRAARASIHFPTQHRLAVISTGWGVCAIVWKGQSEASKPFVEHPAQALLSQIMTPGLSVDELRGVLLTKYPGSNEVIADRSGNFHPEIVPTWFPELNRRLQSYYSTRLHDPIGSDASNSWRFWRLQLDWSQLTPFQKSVLDHTASIPRGQKRTYGEVARAIGKPLASRAVGAALGANPWPVLVPCHRLVGANGSMTGFSAPGGIRMKQRMLALEACAIGVD